MTNEIPHIIIGRLPIYLRELTRIAREEQKETTSSYELGQRLGISSAQIRKDLSQFGEFGKQGTGYHIGFLMDQLRLILHLRQEWPMALVGAGYLGHAMAHYGGFQHRSFRVECIFDNDPEKVGVVMNGVVVQDVSELETTIQEKGIKVALLAVPAQVAQEVTDKLVQAGVKAILNYAPIHLNAPPDIHIGYSDPVIQLQQMTYYLSPVSELL